MWGTLQSNVVRNDFSYVAMMAASASSDRNKR